MHILAARGASGEDVPHSTDNEDLKALHLAARHGQVEVVKLLLEEAVHLDQSGTLLGCSFVSPIMGPMHEK